jgi:hypothetical protein
MLGCSIASIVSHWVIFMRTQSFVIASSKSFPPFDDLCTLNVQSCSYVILFFKFNGAFPLSQYAHRSTEKYV